MGSNRKKAAGGENQRCWLAETGEIDMRELDGLEMRGERRKAWPRVGAFGMGPYAKKIVAAGHYNRPRHNNLF